MLNYSNVNQPLTCNMHHCSYGAWWKLLQAQTTKHCLHFLILLLLLTVPFCFLLLSTYVDVFVVAKKLQKPKHLGFLLLCVTVSG